MFYIIYLGLQGAVITATTHRLTLVHTLCTLHYYYCCSYIIQPVLTRKVDASNRLGFYQILLCTI